MIRCTTESGSVYEIDGDLVRRVTRSPISDSERVTREFKKCELVNPLRVGDPMMFFWGTGVDEHSPEGAEALGEANRRYTITTPIKTIEEC